MSDFNNDRYHRDVWEDLSEAHWSTKPIKKSKAQKLKEKRCKKAGISPDDLDRITDRLTITEKPFTDKQLQEMLDILCKPNKKRSPASNWWHERRKK